MNLLAASNPETAELVFVIACVLAVVGTVVAVMQQAWVLALISAALAFASLGLYLL